jgi:hypothetical protein
MSHDIDRLMDSAFERDRERLPKGSTSAPQALIKKASLPVSAAETAFLSTVWFKVALGIVTIGSVVTYFALRGAEHNEMPTAITPVPASSVAPVIDSPIVRSDSAKRIRTTVAQPSKNIAPSARPGVPSQALPPALSPPIIDSGVNVRDSINSLRRAK